MFGGNGKNGLPWVRMGGKSMKSNIISRPALETRVKTTLGHLGQVLCRASKTDHFLVVDAAGKIVPHATDLDGLARELGCIRIYEHVEREQIAGLNIAQR